MKTDELREKYLTFFQSKGCVRRPSDVLVPRWDKSVLFTPAGMNQFKDHFLGRCKLEFTRATTCQKCLRTGDIENVGRTAYHHTFFEMLGNFSFGDYFKRDAIHWAWEFVTGKSWLGIDPARLSVSVYQDDDEAAGIWTKDVKLPPEKIRRLGEADNFWPASAPSQGPDGVCGPCSEIFFHPDGGGEVEIWNLVFTQFNRVGDPPDNLRPLPSKNIDTGMGLERTASVLQGVTTNFHIDILRPLVEAAGEVCRVKYDPDVENGRRLRRIADHVRACTFAIHENVYPDPQKQGYVIRRLLRRAVLEGHRMGVRQPFMHQLVPVVAELMRVSYPELAETADRVAEGVRTEEQGFFEKIDAGLAKAEKVFEKVRRDAAPRVEGRDAFDMYQTHGFPPELFESMAAERNVAFDWTGYRKAEEEHKGKSGGPEGPVFAPGGPVEALKKTLGATEFLGYDATEAQAVVKGIIARDELCDSVEEIGHDQPIVVVLDRSPFYGESGGQVGDTGELTAEGVRFEVTDTQRDGELILHLGHLRQGTLQLDATLSARVDSSRRQAIRRAHTATHVLHHALQKHLGGRAQQRGSKVDRDYLRFDFTHAQAVSAEELRAVEEEVNHLVLRCDAVGWSRLPISQARQAGAMMLFGEKYPDVVRMVEMGEFSKELCGGTHLSNVGQVGLFRIVKESSVSAGTRRIEAITGPAALAASTADRDTVRSIKAELKTQSDDPQAVYDAVKTLLKERKKLEKDLAAGARAAGPGTDDLLAAAATVGDARVVIAELAGDAGRFREEIDKLRRKAAPIAVLLASREEGRVTLVAGISRDLQARGLDAGRWVKAAAAVVGGSGGGKPDLAQAGGKLPDKLPDALAAARREIEQQLGS